MKEVKVNRYGPNYDMSNDPNIKFLYNLAGKLKWLFVLIPILILCFAFFTIFIGGFGDNSNGERIGELNKLSDKGWFFKTWEGEMSVGSGGLSVYVFEFTVCDKNQSKIDMLQNAIGKSVKFTYSSPRFYFKWNQDTKYCIEKVEVSK